MFKSIASLLRVISTEDDQNKVVGMIRAGWLTGLGVILAGGIAMIVTMLGNLFTLKTATDFQSFGIGFAAWSGGLAAYITAGAGALWMQAKADAVAAPTIVTRTVDKPPGPSVTTTTTVEPLPKDQER